MRWNSGEDQGVLQKFNTCNTAAFKESYEFVAQRESRSQPQTQWDIPMGNSLAHPDPIELHWKVEKYQT